MRKFSLVEIIGVLAFFVFIVILGRFSFEVYQREAGAPEATKPLVFCGVDGMTYRLYQAEAQGIGVACDGSCPCPKSP